MAKTFIPQYIRMLRKLAKYASTHGSTMQSNMTAAQYATLAQVVAASAVFDGIAINEQP